MNDFEWKDISEIERFKEYYEFSNYAVLVGDVDEDGDSGDYEDLAFGIANIPVQAKRFCLLPHADPA